MSMSRLDLVIFGATGITGKKVVEETIRIAKNGDLTWGVAARSQKKLDNLMTDISKKTGEDLSAVKVIIAEADDENTLKAMCTQTKVVLNCCGPYLRYGEAVVRAAIDSKTHYLDICAEPQFIEQLPLRYNERARDAGVYVVPACACMCVPNDMGVLFLEKNFEGVLNSVESYSLCYILPEYREEAKRSGVVHYTSYESLINSVTHWNELALIRNTLTRGRLRSFRSVLESRPIIHKRRNRWCVPMLCSDNNIVEQTQRYLYERENKRPVHFKAYMKTPGLFYAILLILGTMLLYFMTMFEYTRNLLLKYPSFFTSGMIRHEGPKDEIMDNTYFRMVLYGVGWDKSVSDVDSVPPNKEVVAQVTSVAYLGSATSAVLCAITLLEEGDKLPVNGGVLTTGIMFHKTNLIEKLNENNFKFEIIERKISQ